MNSVINDLTIVVNFSNEYQRPGKQVIPVVATADVSRIRTSIVKMSFKQLEIDRSMLQKGLKF